MMAATVDAAPGRARTHWSALGILIAAAPAGFFFAIVLSNGVNLPYQDDYDAVLWFLNHFPSATAAEKMRLLFASHNEHRIAFPRILIYLSHLALGRADMRLMFLIGDLSLVALAFTLYGMLRVNSQRLITFLPVPFLLFQPQFYEGAVWAQVALSNFWVYALALASFHFMERSDSWRGSALAMGLQATATFTHGNGLLGPVVTIAFLMMQRRFTRAAAWAVFVAGLTLCYDHNYDGPPLSGRLESLHQPFRVLQFYFAFLGSCVGHRFWPGFVLASCFVFLMYLRLDRRHPGLMLSLAFLHATAGLASVMRSQEALEHAAVSRYRFFSTLVLTATYVGCATTIGPVWRRRVNPAFIALAIVFNLVSFRTSIPHMRENRRQRICSVAEWKRTGNAEALLHSMPVAAAQMLETSIATGIYRLPLEVLSECQEQPSRNLQ